MKYLKDTRTLNEANRRKLKTLINTTLFNNVRTGNVYVQVIIANEVPREIYRTSFLQENILRACTVVEIMWMYLIDSFYAICLCETSCRRGFTKCHRVTLAHFWAAQITQWIDQTVYAISSLFHLRALSC